MRKLLFLLFTALATVAILNCSSADDDMPCLSCQYDSYSYRPSSSSSSYPSSSSRPMSSSSEYTGYTGGSCNASDYGAVEIGNQVWMAKNWGCYAPGSKCYNNDPAYCNEYGRLYDWATAMSVCPTGWHVPNNDEWDELVNYIESYWGCSGCAGRYLKAISGWNSGGNGVDKFGFAALPGGYGGSDGSFYGVGYYGYWWSASENSADNADYRDVLYYNENVHRDYDDKSDNLLSVRCLQD